MRATKTIWFSRKNFECIKVLTGSVETETVGTASALGKLGGD